MGWINKYYYKIIITFILAASTIFKLFSVISINCNCKVWLNSNTIKIFYYSLHLKIILYNITLVSKSKYNSMI